MSKLRMVLAGLLIGCLLVLNGTQYLGISWDGTTVTKPQVNIISLQDLPVLKLESAEFERRLESHRDIFKTVEAKPVVTLAKVAPAPKIQPRVEPAQNQIQVEKEAARVNMKNVQVTAIMSTANGYSAIVRAPFFNGPVGVGTTIGRGIFVETIEDSLLRIAHPELQLLRDIEVK